MEIKDLKDLRPVTWGFIVMLVLVTIVPGYLLIFMFNEELFLEVETVKLIFLAISITMPVWALNTFLCFFSKEDLGVMERLQFNGLLGAFYSFIPLYAPALMKVFVDIDNNWAVGIAGGLEIISLILIVCMVYKNNKNSK